jgi:hypothetical protein
MQHLVPRLCLGIHCWRLCLLKSNLSVIFDANVVVLVEAEPRYTHSQAEPGNEFNANKVFLLY